MKRKTLFFLATVKEIVADKCIMQIWVSASTIVAQGTQRFVSIRQWRRLSIMQFCYYLWVLDGSSGFLAIRLRLKKAKEFVVVLIAHCHMYALENRMIRIGGQAGVFWISTGGELGRERTKQNQKRHTSMRHI